MKIVTMTAEHLGEVKALLDVCFSESAWSMDSLRSQMEKADSRCIVAIEQDSVIGFLAFEQVLDEGSIIEVAVAPDCRRKGIAKALITQAIQSADGPAAVFLGFVLFSFAFLIIYTRLLTGRLSHLKFQNLS